MTTDRSLRPLNREFLAERDLRIYQMRAAGASHSDIAKRLDISVSAVGKALQRQTQRLNKEAALAYPEVLRLELERLDKLHAALWPLTQHRRVTLDDGTEITMEPDLRAIDSVLKIMGHRSKLLGMDIQSTNINIDVQGDIRHSLAGAEENKSKTELDYRQETEQILQIMRDSRILDRGVADDLLTKLKSEEQYEIIDVEAIEDETG